MGDAMAVILMGVTGSGKTTVGEMLAKRLDWPYLDGDDFHPEQNVTKMAVGTPLTDEDRWPWLRILADEIGGRIDRGASCLLGCSALKEEYRRVLRLERDESQVRFVHLAGSESLIAGRLSSRVHRYMPASLLRSQFEALEAPADATVIDIDATPDEIADRVLRALGLNG
ncbi:MAG: gluconokinase [Candidatus Latescibacteria bacterium]|jgi:gluconokinase|nr:gluconokinase [Candidatus Latescibacterota bacterium]MDP7449444.1 gluconokinase [Candidatus Latescibacterota bacterium]HJP32490.1 gluconokinase [Candidatus Latescibacterota bacterium]